MKTKRIFAWFLTLAMIMTLIPSFSLFSAAQETETETTVIQSSTKENTNQAGGIIYTKTSTANSDGTIDITLTAHTTGVVRQTSSVEPTDIVLVLDASGSMDDQYDSFQVTTYEEVLGRSYTYRTGIFNQRTGYGFNNQSSYYINTGTTENPVYTRVSRTSRDNNGYEYFEYTRGNTEVYVYPELTNGTAANRSNAYPVYQFYSSTTTTTTTSRMDVLKNAVNAFIDTTATMNEGLETDEMHTISIVKFAGERYSNNTTNTPVITEGDSTYTSGGNTYNYSQVVKGLTTVDATGAAALKTAVNGLSPAGSTAVDKGLALAEAVLMNRSQVVGDGAVDRKEVVIVFSDGSPTYSNGFQDNVANSAITVAGNMKSATDVTIYSVCIDTDADATDTDENINKFMHYVSSNYPNAKNMTTPGENGSINNGYYLTPDDSHSLSMLFDEIIHNIDHPSITLGKEATMVDTISPYFDFENGEATDITLQTRERTAGGGWTEPVDDENLSYSIVNDRLTVNGFNFDENFISETGRGENNDFYGKQLVVSFKVIPDYDAIDAASVTLGDGILPTNSGFAFLVNSGEIPAAVVTTPELDTFNVTYVFEGITEEPVSYNRFAGSEITVNDPPQRTGYNFLRWEYPDIIEVVNSEFVMPKDDVIIKGIYEPIEYTVTYVLSGVDPRSDNTMPEGGVAYYGDTITVAEPLSEEGFTFVGWAPRQTSVTIYVDEDDDNKKKFTMPAGNVTLIGYFEPGNNTPYTVEHYLEDFTDGSYTLKERVGKIGTTEQTVTEQPLSFHGFTFNSEDSVTQGEISPDGSLTLKLYYDRNEFDVIYEIDGVKPDEAQVPERQTYKFGETVEVEDILQLDGYIFTGWYNDLPETDPSYVDISGGSFTMPNHDVYIAGYFTASSDTPYTVEHYLENLVAEGEDVTYGDGKGNLTPVRTEEFAGTTDTLATANPVPFTGFTFDETIEGTVRTELITGDGELTLKLYYKRNEYTVYYDIDGVTPDGVTEPDDVKVKYGDLYTVEDALSADGYDFNGWYHSSDPDYADISGEEFPMPDRDVYIAGHFTERSDTAYTVLHYLQKLNEDGTAVAGTDKETDYELANSLTQNLKGVTGTEVTVNALLLTGYKQYAGDTHSQTDNILADGSLVFEFYYDRLTHDVSYAYTGTIPNDPDLIDPDDLKMEDVPYGATVIVDTTVTEPWPDGFTDFSGWHPHDDELVVEDGKFVMPAYDIELHGFFTPSDATPYTIYHHLQKLNEDGTGIAGTNKETDYQVIDSLTQCLQGTTGTEVTAHALAFNTYKLHDGDPSSQTAEIQDDGNLELHFYYDRIKYGVEYVYEGTVPTGTDPAPTVNDKYPHGVKVNFEDEPSAVDGYTFGGWHIHDTDIDTTEEDFTMPSRDVVVYGRFSPNTDTPYTVEHYLENLVAEGEDVTYGDGEGNLTPVRTEYFTGTTDTQATSTPVPYTGFTFDETIEGTVRTELITGDGELTLKLYYKRNEYTVYYDIDGVKPDGVTEPDDVKVKYGDLYTVEDALYKEGYVFSGWYHSSDPDYADISGEEFTMPDRDVYIAGIFANATDTPYKVEHYLENLVAEGEDLTYGDGRGNLTPVRTENFTGTTGAEISALVVHFTGFTFDEEIEGTVKDGNISPDGDTVLKLYYERNKYPVTYEYEGVVPENAPELPSDNGDAFMHKYNSNVAVQPVPDESDIPDGYTFHGWETADSDLTINENSFTMPAESVTFIGHFHANADTPYHINHFLQKPDGKYSTVPTETETRHATTDTSATVYARKYEGYSFDKETTNGNNTEPVVTYGDYNIITQDIDGNGTTTFNFYYGINKHDVTYVYEGATPAGVPDLEEYSKTNVPYGTQIEVEPTPHVPGYTFNGWNTPDAEIADGEFAMPDRDVALKGSFSSNMGSYMVNYRQQNINNDEYTLVDTATYHDVYTGQLVQAEIRAYTGFALNREKSKQEGYVLVEEPGENGLVLDLYYDRHAYNITYGYYGEQPEDAPDLSGLSMLNVRYGTENIEVEDKPEFEGYFFDGWYTSTATVVDNRFTMPNHYVTFLGRFIPQYTVSYDLNGGTGAEGEDYNAITVLAGTEITVKATPTRSGYTFKGWNDGTTDYEPGDTVTVNSDITFKAKWSRNGGGGGSVINYTLTYETNGGSKIATETHSFGTKVELTKVPVKEGYVFEGWHLDEALSEDVTEVQMNKNITVYAAWVEDNGSAGNGSDTPGSLDGEHHIAYIIGYPDKTVRPLDHITRAEVATILFRLLKEEVRNENLTDENSYTDVANDAWYGNAVSTLTKMGIVHGRTDTEFMPDEYITRAEFASFCARFDDSEFEIVDHFTDVEGHWAEAEIHEAAAHGWIRGYEDNTFKPDRFITRAEAMTMINRVLNRIPETADDLLANMISWPDNNDESEWYYLPVQEATNSHEYEMKNHVYEKWTALKESDDWSKYEE